MIYIIDRSSVGQIHVPFNSAMVNVFLEAYPEDQIVFIGEHSHLDNVKKLMKTESSRVTFKSQDLIKSTGKSIVKYGQWIKKLGLDRRFFNDIFSKAEGQDAIVFFCSVPPISMPLMVQSLRKFSKLRVLLTLHGELELMFEAKNIREKIVRFFFRKLFDAKLKNLYFLLLNKIAKNILVSSKVVDESMVLDITHPYSYSSYTKEQPKDRNNKSRLTLGHVGSLGIRKNGQELFNIAKLFRKEIQDNKVIFNVVGFVEEDLSIYQNEWVHTIADNPSAYIERTFFEERLNDLDYALFFYAPSQFVFRASGAIFDVIEFEKPIIVLKHPYFESMFATAGNIGFICNDLNEMKQLIGNLISKEPSLINQYKLQKLNIQKYKDSVDIKNVAIDLKQQIFNMNY